MSTSLSYVPDWLEKRAGLTPDKIALIDAHTGESFTYAHWNRNVNQTAYFFKELGVKKGDRVGLLAMNCIEYMDIWFSCNKLGAIFQTLNWRLTATELEGIITDAAPEVLVYSIDFANEIKEIQKSVLCVKKWIALDEPVKIGDIQFTDRENYPGKAFPKVELDPDDPWIMCYTGGTTGLPKGALLTYRSINANAINTIMSWGLDANDIAILNAPLFHTGGLNVFTSPLVQVGGASIICKAFDVEQTFDLINNSGATLFFGVPTMFISMQQHPGWDIVDFSRCKLIISGGAATPLNVFEKFWEKGIDFRAGYGLTEAGPNNFWLPAEDVRRKPGFVGLPLFHIDIKLVAENGKETGDNEMGEVIIRGDHVFKGYWNNSKAAEEMLKEGWLHTGDLAIRDEDGYYKIVDRLKDMIIIGGENVYPAEIENILFSYPGIAEACVVGVSDPKWGEVGCAFVVKAVDSLSENEILEYCKNKLVRYKVPQYIKFVDELPKTSAGKLDKKLLKKIAEAE